MPEISVVILTFNSVKFIESCLESLFIQDYKHFEVIVVDNGSIDGIIDFIKKRFPEVKLIANKTNLGACKARNQAIGIAQGKWILTLDCDIVLEKNFLGKIMKFAQRLEDSVGALQPKILKPDAKTVYSCGIYLSKFLKRFHDIGQGKLDNGQFNVSKYIFGACSGAALYKRQMLEDIQEKTGYFDERLFFLAEDLDLSWRAQKKGWKTIYYPDAACYHFGNSSGYAKKFRQYLCWRNRYYSIIKNEGLNRYISKIIPLLFYDFPRFFYLVFTNPYILKSRSK